MQVAEHCYEHQITIGKFVRERHLQRPPSPGEQATEEQILKLQTCLPRHRKPQCTDRAA